MPEDKQFLFEIDINAPADLIFRAFTSATALREWLCDISTTNPEVGGRIYLAWNRGYFASGQFTHLIPNEAVSFTWIGKTDPDWTQVEVAISPIEQGSGCTVVLRHTGVDNSAGWESAQHELSKGWKIGLDNLKVTLEEGRDLRIVNRPLIGIYPEDLSNINKLTKDELNIPVDKGVMVTEVVPEFGAEKAGIQPKDVLVGINGQKITGIKSLIAIISELSADDQISVDMYRGSEHLSVSVDAMTQKARTIPDSPEELAKEIEASSSKLLETLENVLSGVTEAEASYSPSPEEWSVKETLVHLIHNERDLHSWINDLVSGQERFYDEWPGDRLFRIRATLTTYPNLDNLMAELQRSLKETVASVAFLDQEFTRRKASYWRLGTELLGVEKHVQEHIRQIEENIRAARASKSA